MKLTTLLLIAVILQVNARALAQKVTLSDRAVSLTVVFDQIRAQTGYDFAFTVKTLNNAKPVSINVKNASLDEVLKKIFDDQPLSYSIEDKFVVVTRKTPSLLYNLKDGISKILNFSTDISGSVTDNAGQPLAGAAVYLKDTKYYTLTDDKGNFHFSSINSGKYTMVISYLGYQKLEVPVEINGKTLKQTFSLLTAISPLDQVQVIAYGKESKRFSTQAVSTVTSDQIEKQPVSNPLLALQGQSPGLAVTAGNGVPGSSVLVQIRGQNTLRGPVINTAKPYDQPLFIVDGVPSATQNVNINQLTYLANSQTASGNISQPTGLSPFNSIDPHDIESITILKDAGATSIYGSQGANGVILITTKRGKPGKTTFDLNLNSQFNTNAQPVQLLNTQQYLQLRKDAFAADGLTPSNNPNNFFAYAPDLTIYDQNRYTNWPKLITGRTTHNTDLHASVYGGTPVSTYYLSGGYTRSDYNYPGDFADQKFTFHSALRNTSANKRFIANLVTDYGYDNNNSAGFGGSQSITLPPNLPSLIDPTGNLLWSYNGTVPIFSNFYASLLMPANMQSFNFNNALNLSYEIIKGLNFGINMGYNRNNNSEHSIDPKFAQNPSINPTSGANFANGSYQAINIEPQLSYNKTIGRGVLTALMGATYRKNTSYNTQTIASGYANDSFLNSVNAASTVRVSDNSNISKYNAGFARFNYIYDQKYIVEVSGRRDGSSNFGPGHQFGNFGAASAGWIFSQEKLLKDALPSLSFGKLYGSYGTTGSDAALSYSYQAFYQSVAPYILNYQGVRQSVPVNLYNPYFSWSTKKALNLALDLGFFKDRLLLNATYYRNRESSQLIDYPLASQTGFSSVYGNLNATVQNQGWEFTLTSNNIKSKDITWNSTFNLTFNRNKLLSFPNLSASSYSSTYQIGLPVSVIYGYRYKGVNPTTGLFEFYDKKGNATSAPTFGPIATGGDMVPIANREFNYMGGLGNTFSYQNFSLSIFCQFTSSTAPNYLYSIARSVPGTLTNEPTALLGNYWKNPGDNTVFQRLASSFGSAAFRTISYFGQSSGAYSNDTYLRVKTVSCSYALPKRVLAKVNMQSANIFVNAQNLLTVTNYKVGDPEQPGSFANFPLQRIVALGLNVKF